MKRVRNVLWTDERKEFWMGGVLDGRSVGWKECRLNEVEFKE